MSSDPEPPSGGNSGDDDDDRKSTYSLQSMRYSAAKDPLSKRADSMRSDKSRSRHHKPSRLSGISLGRIMGNTKQPDFASFEDLEDVKELLRSDIQNTRIDMHARLDHIQETLTAGLETMAEKVSKTERSTRERMDKMEGSSQEIAEKCCRKLQEELGELINSVKSSTHQEFQASHDALRERHTEDIKALKSRVDEELTKMRSELTTQIDRVEAEMTASDQLEHERMSEESQTLQKQIRDIRRQALENLTRTLSRIDNEKERTDALELKQHETWQTFNVDLKQIRGCITDLEVQCDKDKSESRSLTLNSVRNLRDVHERFTKNVGKEMESLRCSLAETNSIPTRKVEWIARHISRDSLVQDDGNFSPGRSWLSPKFPVAGAGNLQLGLRLLEQTEKDRCDCELSLWGQNCDLRLVCKLYVGETSWHCEHTFSEESPCCIRRIDVFSDPGFFEEEPPRIGVEVLEAIRTISCEHELEIQDEVGSLVLHQYINHNLMDCVQEQVDRMRSRMTRRVEWRVEQASCLRQCFAEGESLCSSTFMAAGLDGLQLVFYPSGYTGAKECFCSLFLYYPGCSALHCWLSAGKQRREARIAFVKQPGFFGRTNFCRFDSCIDTSDDSVLLALEIEEVEHTVRHSVSHSIPKEQLHQLPLTPDPIDAGLDSRCPSRSVETRSATPTIESVVKLQRLPGKVALEDVRSLPSIWTPLPVANVGAVLEGFHRFSDMRSRTPRKPPPGRRFRSNYDPFYSCQTSGYESPGLSVASSRPASRNDARVLQKYTPYAQ